MATVTRPEPRPTNLDPRVSHPLDQLRGVIRRYVVIEAVLSAVLFFGVWFALGLVADFVLFRATAWDWVLDAPWVLRLLALIAAVVLFLGTVTLRLVRRLSKELSYPSLALVLERRFPRVLGDRLITAVELADVARAARDGYSVEMVRQTIAEARSRVGDVPVSRVFNWRRLWRMGYLAVGLAVAVVIVGYVSFAIAAKSMNPYRFGWRFIHVSATFLERDLLLQDTPWPRQAHMELMGFQGDEPLRVGRDSGAPTVRARAFRYVIADKNERLGWRPMKWTDNRSFWSDSEYPDEPFATFQSIEGVPADGSAAWRMDDVVIRAEGLSRKLADVRASLQALNAKADELLGQNRLRRLPGEASPDRWQVPDPAAASGWRPLKWSEVKLVLGVPSVGEAPVSRLKPAAGRAVPVLPESPPGEWSVGFVEVQTTALEAELTPVLKTLGQLAELADQPSMGRRLRRLDVPGRVTLEYAGSTKTGSATLTAEQNHEFAGQVTDLKEDVWFTVKAEDFRTDPREINLINPPLFERLIRTDYQPAYLYHAPPIGEFYDAFRETAPDQVLPPPSLRDSFATQVMLATAYWRTQKLPPQRMRELPLALTGDRSVFTVPAGTEVVLTGLADADLRAAYIEPRAGLLPGGTPGSRSWIPLKVGADGRTVTVELRGDYKLGAGRDVFHVYQDEAGWVWGETLATTPTVEFDLILEQTYGVQSRRQILIQTTEDQAPSVEVALDGVRKVNNIRVQVNKKSAIVPLPVPCYLVTPDARLEFHTESVVRDDRGLSEVSFEVDRWVQTYTEAGEQGRVAEPKIDRIAGSSFPVGRFVNLRQPGTRTRAELVQLLLNPLRDEDRSPQVTTVKLSDPNTDIFDLRALRLAPPTTDEGQLHYRIDLAVQAVDTNYATGPRRTRNRDPINLLVVSEAELLATMNADENAMASRLDQVLAAISQARGNFQGVVRADNGGPPHLIGATRMKAIEIGNDVNRSRTEVQGVLLDCRRLYRECQINRVSEKTTARYGRLANRIDRVLGVNPTAINDEEKEELAEGRLRPKGTFELTSPAVAKVVNELVPNDKGQTGKWADPKLIDAAETELVNLEQELLSIRSELGDVIQLNNNVRRWKLLLANRKLAVSEELLKLKVAIEGDLTSPNPRLQPVGQVLLAKGQSKTVKQKVAWRQYAKPDLTIALSSSDPDGVTVTGQVKLKLPDDPEILESEFEFEVKAGQKLGDFIVTLKPSAGDPVQIMVKVQ